MTNDAANPPANATTFKEPPPPLGSPDSPCPVVAITVDDSVVVAAPAVGAVGPAVPAADTSVVVRSVMFDLSCPIRHPRRIRRYSFIYIFFLFSPFLLPTMAEEENQTGITGKFFGNSFDRQRIDYTASSTITLFTITITTAPLS